MPGATATPRPASRSSASPPRWPTHRRPPRRSNPGAPPRSCNRSPRRCARTPTSRSSRSWRRTARGSPTPTPLRSAGAYIGTIEPALRGETFTEIYTGTLGPSVRAVAPVRDQSGRVIGLVSAGILQRSLAEQLAGSVAGDRRGRRWRTWPLAARRVGHPPPAAAPDPRASPGRAARDVRPPRRDPALGVRGPDRAGPQRGGAGQRRGTPPAVAACRAPSNARICPNSCAPSAPAPATRSM